MIASYDLAKETLYLAKKEDMINGDFVFILFELNQASVARAMEHNFFWFYHRQFLTPFRLVSIFLLYY